MLSILLLVAVLVGEPHRTCGFFLTSRTTKPWNGARLAIGMRRSLCRTTTIHGNAALKAASVGSSNCSTGVHPWLSDEGGIDIPEPILESGHMKGIEIWGCE